MLELLKSRVFLVGQGLVALIVLVIVLGRVFHLSTTIQLAAIMAIMVVGLILLLVGYVRANRSASAIQTSLRQQAEHQRMGVRPDKQGEIEQLERDLEEAIERLKQSRLGGGRRRSKAALYAMPWYMIIGPPAAGKTTAIANSGMNFPLGTDSVRGVGGTRNCDWFFSDSAIFLDTAGRYMTEQEDQEEWHTFLQTLRDNRSKQPINGVIVAINVDALVDATPDQIEWHATTIRRRVDDLVSRLHVTFPVYLVFTKCDLLRGFVQFFGYFNRKEREQVWGFTLPQEWQRESDIRERFEAEFARLSRSLVNWRNEGLGRAMKREQRQAVYVFPLEFASAKEKLSQFVTMLFRPNPYRDTPLLRGVYFTSGTQEGVPIDRVIRAIAHRFGLAPAEQDAEPVTEAKAYFIRDLFETIIIPDRYLVSRTSRFEKRQTLLKATTVAVSGIVLLLFLLGVGQAVVRSQLRINEAVDSATTAALVDPRGSVLEPSELDRLESLRSVVARIDQRSYFTWGLDRGGEVFEPALRLLLQKVGTFVDLSLFGHLEDRIASALSMPALDEVTKEALYDDFKTYLLLTEQTVQLSDEANGEFLKRQLASLVDSVTGRGATADPRHYPLTDLYVDGLRDGHTEGLAANRRLVRRAQPILSEPISPERLFARLRREAEETLGLITLSEAAGPNGYLFETDPSISELFTQNVWSSFARDKIEEYSADPTRDEWVTGATVARRTLTEEEVAARIEAIYLEEYAAEWEEMISGAVLAPFQNVRDAARKLEILSNGDDSPILWLLARVSDETTFEGSMLETTAEALGGGDERILNAVERHFQPLHELNVPGAASGTADPRLLRALEELKRIGATLESMVGDDAKLADYAAEVVSSGGGELGGAIRAIEDSFFRLGPSVRENLFERPVLLTWSTVLESVQEYLDEQWRERVYEPFRETVGGRYPIDAGDDAPIDDFEIFFRDRTGTLASFYEEQLSPFLQTNRVAARTWQNRGLTVSASVADAFERAKTLREVLFEGDRLRYTFELLPEIPVSTQPVSSYDLDIHGHRQRYDMGAPYPLTVTWPGSPGSTLRVSARDGDLLPIRFDGHWAMFRLLRAADIARLSSTEFELSWDMGSAVTARYRVRTRSAVSPFMNVGDFFRITIPPTLSG